MDITSYKQDCMTIELDTPSDPLYADNPSVFFRGGDTYIRQFLTWDQVRELGDACASALARHQVELKRREDEEQFKDGGLVSL